MPYSTFCKISISLVMLSAGQYSNAQKNSGLPEKIEYTREARFIHEAPVLLAALLRDGKSDQVRNFIENWKKSDAPSDELIGPNTVVQTMPFRARL